MDVIILAGGRGLRMGGLTHTQQKGTLSFHGQPILKRIIDSLLPLSSVGTIHIATGYRADDIRLLLEFHYPEKLLRNKIHIAGIHGITGTQSRLAAALKQIPDLSECLVTGIDILTGPALFLYMLHRAQAMEQKRVVLCASPRLEVAPTHWLNRVEDGTLAELAACDYKPAAGTWLREMGLRYFPPHIVQLLRGKAIPNGTYFMPLVREVMAREPVLVHSHPGEWHHFAEQEDLFKAPGSYKVPKTASIGAFLTEN